MKIFINDKKNKNTLRKALGDTQKIMKFPKQNGESRDIFHIPHDELDPLFAIFILSIRKADGSEYKPTSLRSMISSMDRKLKRHQYPCAIMGSSGPVFSLTREALKAKQRQQKQNKEKAISHMKIRLSKMTRSIHCILKVTWAAQAHSLSSALCGSIIPYISDQEGLKSHIL